MKWWLLVTIHVFDFTETMFHYQCFVYDFQNSPDKTNWYSASKCKKEATYYQINLVLLLTLKMLIPAGYRPWHSLLKIIRCFFVHRREIPLYSFSDEGAHWYSKYQLLWALTGKRAWFAIFWGVFWQNTFLKIFQGILLLVKPAALGLQRH